MLQDGVHRADSSVRAESIFAFISCRNTHMATQAPMCDRFRVNCPALPSAVLLSLTGVLLGCGGADAAVREREFYAAQRRYADEQAHDRAREAASADSSNGSTALVSPTTPAPTSAAGFGFGMTASEVTRICNGIGALPNGSFICTPAAPVGFDGAVSIDFCDGRACELMIVRERSDPVSDERWAQLYDELHERLADKYGQATREERSVPDGCSGGPSTLLRCIRSGEATVRSVWNWYGQPTGIVAQVVLVLGRTGPNADAMLIFYRDSAGVVRRLQQRNRQDDNL
jgi:hypothetical protein